jgi:hypothetical protein
MTDAYLLVNSVNLSGWCRSLTLNYEAEMLDDTTMGTTGTRSNRPGLKNWSIDAEFLQDYDAGAVDATLFSLIGAAAFPIELRPTSAAVSATNPSYTGNAVLETYPPMSGEVGALSNVSATFRSGGGSVLTRATV